MLLGRMGNGCITIFSLLVCYSAHECLAATPKELWSFSAASWVTVVEPIADLSEPRNGGQDLLVGSADDTLYLIEGYGAGAGGELWRVPMQSTVSAIKAIGDVNQDNRPDVVAGDMANIVYCISGGTGKRLWGYLTKGTILSLAEIPDVNNDGVRDVVAGSEDDTVYCFSGSVPGMQSSTQLGQVIWKFATVQSRKGNQKIARVCKPVDRPQGANSLAVVSNTDSRQIHGIIIGASSDSVFCISATGQGGKPVQQWVFTAPGDIWNVQACGDTDGDAVEDVLVACGANISYLLSGKTGQMLWSCKADGGAQVALAAGDVNGDGVADGWIGDGYGNVRCVSGKSRGSNVTPLWVFSTGDSGTILSFAAPGDLDGNKKPECVFGSNGDFLYAVSDAGQALWSVNMLGSVNSVAMIAHPKIDGVSAVAAGSNSSFATVFSGTLGENALAGRGDGIDPRKGPEMSSFMDDAVSPVKKVDLLGRTALSDKRARIRTATGLYFTKEGKRIRKVPELTN